MLRPFPGAMAEPDPQFIDQKLVRALAHPLRVRILDFLNSGEASPNEISKGLEAPLSSVCYHASVLMDCGCIELTRTEQKRGAVEHFLRAVPRSQVGHQDWRAVPRTVRSEVTAAALDSFLVKASAALEAGTIDDRDDSTLSWMPLTVDRTGRDEVTEIVRDALAKLQGAHDRSRERVEASGEPPVTLIVALAAFEAAPGA